MSAKKKPIVPQPNVVIIDPDTETTTNINEMSDITKGEIKKGYKACPSCGEIIAARSMTCKHCNYVIPPKDPNAPKTATTRTPRAATVKQSEKPEISLLKVLKNRGFDVKMVMDALDPNSTPEISLEPKIKPIMELLPYYNSNGKFELGLDHVLTLLKIPLNK